ncbi:3-oxoacyl-[acyl-carrier-protein] reductase [candidate division WOR-3 bacterium]|nr:3-oxoacyl-[acyl-carrier-protein] reductase [candidate division WOR-3 bacterium]
MKFENKSALITGGKRGIGKAIALKFAENGVNVAIIDIGPDNDNELIKEFSTFDIKFIYKETNVADSSEVNKTINDIVEVLGSIDILVNNAGITRDNLLIRMEDSEWDSVISVNLSGTYNCTKAILPIMMKKRWGRIINIASVIGEIGNIGQSNYAASKAGIIGFTKSVAKEVARRNINANAIAPGFIETEMTKKLPENIVTNYLNSIPQKKLGKPEDVANTVLFLASDMADYITGQVINVDGGLVT